jgi:hypothetical protein
MGGRGGEIGKDRELHKHIKPSHYLNFLLQKDVGYVK